MKVATFHYDLKAGWMEPPPFDWDSPQTLVFVFGASSFLDFPEPLQELALRYPQAKVVGCSTAGEILGCTINDDSLSGAVVKFDQTSIVSATAAVHSPADSYQAGEQIGQALMSSDLRSILVFSDGLNVNGSQLVAGLNAVLPATVNVTGGLAGDRDQFKRTWVLKDGLPQSNIVSAVGLYGRHVQVGHGSKGGWDIFGPERKVTKSQNNLLCELDGKPALQLYKEYLGDRASELPAAALLFPLALRAHAYDEKRIVRTILSVDEEHQTMTFAGDLPEGSFVQLMRANFDRLIDGASEAALMTAENKSSGSDVLSLAISCVGRRLILGERAEEELEAVLDVLPQGVHQIGFYSYGEISPYTSGHCDLHNQTMTLTTITEG